MKEYKEIHPFNRLSGWSINENDKFREKPPIVIRLDTIRQIVPLTDKFTTLKVSEDCFEDIIVTKEEGDEIKGVLLGE